MHELVLTSTSPRRRQILNEAGYKFRTFPLEVSEILNENMSLHERISDCARQKVMAAVESGKLLKSKEILLLGADTVVVHEGQILGKPRNEQDATQILTQLSGQIHSVITGFCLFDLTTERLILDHDITSVHFKKLSPEDIREYVESGDPMDKAGAYGIQTAAKKFVESYEGSLNNVIGLPS
jgi:septum formation protein